PWPENQVRPSCTRSSLSVYWPIALGGSTASETVAVPPAGTSAVSFPRLPSHTAVVPSLLIQWYARFTGVGPAAGHTRLPVFATVTETFAGVPRAMVDDTAAPTVYEAPYPVLTFTTSRGALTPFALNAASLSRVMSKR